MIRAKKGMTPRCDLPEILITEILFSAKGGQKLINQSLRNPFSYFKPCRAWLVGCEGEK